MYVIRHWSWIGILADSNKPIHGLSVASLLSNFIIGLSRICQFPRKVGGVEVESSKMYVFEKQHRFYEDSKTNHSVRRLIDMDIVEGFCLKCKTYGLIKDGQLIKMKNGRTRMAGVCSQPGCTGKISKIVS